MLKTRIYTGAILSVAFVGMILLSHIPWVLHTVSAFLCVGAICELYRATGLVHNKCIFYITCCVSVLVSFAPALVNEYIILILLIAAVVLFAYLMANVKNFHHIPQGISMLVAVMIIFFINSICKIRTMEYGIYLLALAILTPVLTDIFAYVIGRAFGKTKLAPVISPKKTVEGSLGGTIATVLILSLVALALDCGNVIQVKYGFLILYLFITSAFAQFGDLAFSSIKRIVKIKDYGKLLPGHGGIMDRFDSWVFSMPVTCLFCIFIGSMIV